MKVAVLLVLIVALLIPGCSREPSDPPSPVPVITLGITAEIGVEIGDTSYVFGHVVDIVRTDSLVHVLDMSRAGISSYDNEGLYAGGMGRRGSGPGELASPRNLLLTDDRILIQDIDGLKLYERNGTWNRYIFEHFGNWPVQNRMVDDSTFCVVWHSFEREDPPIIRPFIGVYGLDGEKICEIWADSIRIPVPPDQNNRALNSWRFGHYLTGDGAGSIFHHRRHTGEYLIRRFSRTGELAGQISRGYTPVAKTPEEILLEKEYIEDMLAGSGTTNVMQWIYEPDPWREPVAGIWVCGGGNLWVLLGTEDTPTFDVWSISEEELLYRAVLPLEIPPDEFLTFYITPRSPGIAAVHEDRGMVQRVLLIEPLQPPAP